MMKKFKKLEDYGNVDDIKKPRKCNKVLEVIVWGPIFVGLWVCKKLGIKLNFDG